MNTFGHQNLEGLTLIYSSAIRRTATILVLACIAGSTVVGLLHEPRTPLLAWTSLTVGAISLALVLATRPSPKRDTVLFIISGISGAMFIAAATVDFPGTLPIWLWTIGAICIGTAALIVDAESAQSKSVNRL
jgi:peptidoglycan/LPS O-acetylase OafA/YrhL